jgi:hypothetical protein
MPLPPVRLDRRKIARLVSDVHHAFEDFSSDAVARMRFERLDNYLRTGEEQ